MILLQTHIDAKIDFPGIGNTWKTSIGPLPISSGVNVIPQAGAGTGLGANANAYDISVPP